MEIKLFGKSLFEFRGKKGAFYLDSSVAELKKSKYLPDFFSRNNRLFSDGDLSEYIVAENPSNGQIRAIPIDPIETEKVKLTPKGVYELKMLNDAAFKLNVNPEYVETQLADFKQKLDLIKSEEYDMANGVQEISSIVVRLENRKKYEEHKDFFEQYPYTTTSKINEVVKTHDYLKVGQVAQFMADMPKDAVATMKMYDDEVLKLCEKKAVFYIIADKKDFKKTDGRRDPILLAQSPFGHVWQILGAWDKEMLFLEEL